MTEEEKFLPNWANYRQGIKDGAAEERERIISIIRKHHLLQVATMYDWTVTLGDAVADDISNGMVRSDEH